MNANDAYNVQTGRPMIMVEARPLEDDPALWEEVWAHWRAELLPSWIDGHPGSRPPAWHRFDAAAFPGRAEGEAEVDFLDRIGELSAEEIEAIARKARGLAEFNSCGRLPEKPSTNFIPPGPLESFAARVGLLTAAERSALLLDERGVYLYRGKTPKFEA